MRRKLTVLGVLVAGLMVIGFGLGLHGSSVPTAQGWFHTNTPTPKCKVKCTTPTQTVAKSTKTPTQTVAKSTKTPTRTKTPTPTDTFTPTATNTFTPTATDTFTPTSTNTFTPTSTNTFTPTSTNTFTPTSTNTFTPTSTNTFTPTSTNTFTPTSTNTFTPTSTNTPTNTSTPTDTFTPTVTRTPGPPQVLKLPGLVNLFLCGPASTKCNTDGLVFFDTLDQPVQSRDPKCVAAAVDPTTCPFQTIGSFQLEFRFDAKLITVTVEPGPLLNRPSVQCQSISGQGFVQFRCNTKGKPADAPLGPGVLTIAHVHATDVAFKLLKANQGNGIVTRLINQDCALSDLQGHAILQAGQPAPGVGPGICTPADITIRYLEGDVNGDCSVDVRDQQEIAFRWNAVIGNLLYNSRFDLEPDSPSPGDGVIDAKDLQAVFGRHGSTCAAPHPPQPPGSLKS